MKKICIRLIRLLGGIFFYALGVHFMVQANIGLAPWDALGQGISNITNIAFGTCSTLVGLFILVFVLLLKEKIGIGTIINTIMIGVFLNIMRAVAFLPLMRSYYTGIPLLLLGEFTICIGSFLYIGAGFGCGPRDSLMVALGKRLPKIPIGAIRGCIEGMALLVGWLLGAKVGVGTVLGVFGIGFMVEWVFRMLRFKVKDVKHESIFDSWRMLAAFFASKTKQPQSTEQEQAETAAKA